MARSDGRRTFVFRVTIVTMPQEEAHKGDKRYLGKYLTENIRYWLMSRIVRASANNPYAWARITDVQVERINALGRPDRPSDP